MKKHYFRLTLMLTLLIFALKMVFLMINPALDYASYHHLALVKGILIQPLLAGHPPFFYYLLFPFYLISNNALFLYIIASLFFLTSIPLIYIYAYKITNCGKSAFIASLMSAFSPGFILLTSNFTAPYMAYIPLLIASLYFFSMRRNRVYMVLFLISITLLTFTSPIALALVLSFIIYLIILKLERERITGIEKELITFSIIFVVILEFLIYRKAIVISGVHILWGNLPALLRGYAPQSLAGILFMTGIIPFLLGVYAIYKYFYVERCREGHMLSSVTIAIVVLGWFKIIPAKEAFILLGIIFALLASKTHRIFLTYLSVSKINKLKNFIIVPLVVLAILMNISYAAMNYDMVNLVSRGEIRSLKGISALNLTGRVINHPTTSGTIIYYTGLEPVLTQDFLKYSSPSRIYNDMASAIMSTDNIRITEIAENYGASYVYISHIEESLGDTFKFPENNCFKAAYESKSANIYRVVCKIEITK